MHKILNPKTHYTHHVDVVQTISVTIPSLMLPTHLCFLASSPFQRLSFSSTSTFQCLSFATLLSSLHLPTSTVPTTILPFLLGSCWRFYFSASTPASVQASDDSLRDQVSVVPLKTEARPFPADIAVSYKV